MVQDSLKLCLKTNKPLLRKCSQGVAIDCMEVGYLRFFLQNVRKIYKNTYKNMAEVVERITTDSRIHSTGNPIKAKGNDLHYKWAIGDDGLYCDLRIQVG